MRPNRKPDKNVIQWSAACLKALAIIERLSGCQLDLQNLYRCEAISHEMVVD
jgi:hypothetical protein